LKGKSTHKNDTKKFILRQHFSQRIPKNILKMRDEGKAATILTDFYAALSADKYL